MNSTDRPDVQAMVGGLRGAGASLLKRPPAPPAAAPAAKPAAPPAAPAAAPAAEPTTAPAAPAEDGSDEQPIAQDAERRSPAATKRPRPPRKPRSDSAAEKAGTISVYLSDEAIKWLRERSTRPGATKATVTARVVADMKVSAVLAHFEGANDVPDGFPGAGNYKSPEGGAIHRIEQIRVRPDQRAWFDEQTPKELAEFPIARWLGWAIMEHVQNEKKAKNGGVNSGN